MQNGHAARARAAPRSRTRSLLPLLLVALGIHLLAAVLNEGMREGEDRYRAMNGRDRTTLASRTEPGLLPLAGHAAVMVAERAGLSSPFLHAALLRIVSSLLGLLGAVFVFSAFRGECTSMAARRWLFLLLLLLWFIPLVQARFSPENWSGTLFLLGLAWYYQNSEEGDVSIMVAGIMMALAVFTRFESVVMAGGFLAWLLFVDRADRRVLLSLGGGALIASVVALLADRFFYGSWTLSPWNALVSSLTAEGRWLASPGSWLHGIAEAVRRGFVPIGMAVFVATLFFMATARRHVLTWVVGPALLLYLFSPARQVSDLFVLALALPVTTVLGIQAALEAIPGHERRRRTAAALRWVAYPLWAVNLALMLGAALEPADEYAPLHRLIYNRYGGGEIFLIHDGSDPYARAGGGPAPCTPAFLTRMRASDDTAVDSLLMHHRGSRVLVASRSETVVRRLRRERLEVREVYRSVPEWSVLANPGRWFTPADTILLHEITLRHGTPIAGSGAARR